jgi:hypothetical protein
VSILRLMTATSLLCLVRQARTVDNQHARAVLSDWAAERGLEERARALVPLRLALLDARADLGAREEALEVLRHDDEATNEAIDAAEAALQLAKQAVRTARAALLDSNQLRAYTLEQDGVELEVVATSDEDAEEQARSWALEGDYGDLTKTLWVEITYWSEVDGAAARTNRQNIRVQIDPQEPPCVDGQDHEWEEASVQGHGGGVITTEDCERCRLRMVTDTWAQDHCGRQGLTSVSYRTGEE